MPLYLSKTRLNAQRGMADYIELFATITNVANAINQGLFWKNQGMQCSWCQYQEICFAKSLAA